MARGFSVKIKMDYEVFQFDENTLYAYAIPMRLKSSLDFDSKKYYDHEDCVAFPSWVFRSLGYTRHPGVGDIVELVYNHEDKIVSVRQSK